MIAAHLLDSWTAEPERSTAAYRVGIAIGGMGTVFFLLLAGVAVGLSAGSKLRRSGNAAAAAAAVMRRGGQVFVLALLFRLQAWILGWSSNVRDLLKVDILNIMGPSIVLAALVWRFAGTTRRRAAAFAGVTVATVLITPLLRISDFRGFPEALAAYIVPLKGLSNFVFFPWMGFVFVGAFLGVFVDKAMPGDRESRLIKLFAAGGGALAAGSFAASFLPSPFPNSYFWTTSPAYFFLRVGLATLSIALAYLWTATFVAAGKWSPLIQLGRTSLFIYWIHVEMIYGLVSRPIHHSLSLTQALLAYVLFAVFMLGCSIAKERVVQAYGRVRARPATASPAS